METKKCKKCNQNKFMDVAYDNISEKVEKKINEMTAKSLLETNGNKKVYFGNIDNFREKNIETENDVNASSLIIGFDKKSVNKMMDNKTKKTNMYFCKCCNYDTSYKHHYDKHLTSKKHLKNIDNSSKNTVEYFCKKCNKKYKTRSGVWKHETKCLEQEIIEKQVSNVERKIEKRVKEIGNNELLKVFMDFMKTNQDVQQEMINNIIPKIGNNNNNNISINVFLNEQCKDAINFSDFVNSIQVGVEDVFKTNEIGYSSGISHILMKNLMNLGAFKRPIHCTDNKRLQFIVKDENKWEKDTGVKMEKAITSVSHKQMQEIKKLEKENKIKEEEKYLNLISSAIGPIEEEHKKKNMKEIAKNMGKYLNIKEAMDEKY